MSKITDNIYLGNYYNAMNYQWLASKKITHVLNCAKEIPCTFNKKLTYKHIKGTDIPSFKLLPFLHQAADFINSVVLSKGIVLVHCAAGISRSTTCLIAYYMKYRNTELMRALQFIKSRRTIVRPNPGFMSQLQVFQNMLSGGQSQTGPSFNGGNSSKQKIQKLTHVQRGFLPQSYIDKQNLAEEFHAQTQPSKTQPKSILKKQHPRSILKKGRTRFNSKLSTVDQLTNALNFGYDPNQPLMHSQKMQNPQGMLLEELESPRKKRKSVNFPALEPQLVQSEMVQPIAPKPLQVLSQVPSAYNPRNTRNMHIQDMKKGKIRPLNQRRSSQQHSQRRTQIPQQKFKVKKRGSRSQPRKLDFTRNKRSFANGPGQSTGGPNHNHFEVTAKQMSMLQRKPPLIVNNASNSMYGSFRTPAGGTNNLYNRYKNIGSRKPMFSRTRGGIGGFNGGSFGSTGYGDRFRGF